MPNKPSKPSKAGKAKPKPAAKPAAGAAKLKQAGPKKAKAKARAKESGAGALGQVAPPPAPLPYSPQKLAKARRLQAARKNADHRLHSLPNVVGSCFGVKHAGGVRNSDRLSYTILVTQKAPLQDLSPEDIIPPTVTRLGIEMPTDVQVIGHLRREAGFAIDDGTQVGTLGAFALRDGEYYALTCAHCIAGADEDIDTPTAVRIEYPSRFNLILPLGDSAGGLMLPGTGMQPEFGEFDAALAKVQSPQMLDYVRTRGELPVFEADLNMDAAALAELLQYTPVQGWGAGSNGILRGQIEGVMVVTQGHYFDLMIGDTTGLGLTKVGDSGLIWMGPFGKAYGLHIAGDGLPGSAGEHAFACFVRRPVSRFGVSLLSP